MEEPRACPVVGTQETQKLILRSVIAKSISLESRHAGTFGAVVWSGYTTSWSEKKRKGNEVNAGGGTGVLKETPALFKEET